MICTGRITADVFFQNLLFDFSLECDKLIDILCVYRSYSWEGSTTQQGGRQMAQLWGGRFTKETDKLVYNFNASISFDQKFYKQDIRGR